MGCLLLYVKGGAGRDAATIRLRKHRGCGKPCPHACGAEARRGSAPRPPDYLLTLKPWSLPYLTEASCQAFRPSESFVGETYALPTVSLKIEFAYTWKGR